MKVLEALKELETKLKELNKSSEVFIVGGFVRDFLRKKENNDIDAVVRNADLNTVCGILRTMGEAKLVKIHNVINTSPIDCVLFKTRDDTAQSQVLLVKGFGKKKNNGCATLKQDGSQRDFTINAMYIPVSRISAKNVIDFWGGKNDIIAKQILSVGSAKDKFTKSPIRIMRAFSLAAKTRYNISHHIKHAIVESCHLLNNVPSEVIRIELEKVLLSHKPSLYLRMMQKFGVLRVILPELEACVDCAQDKKYHKYNVFNHLLLSCDNTEPDIILRLAALLHDIGKPESRRESDGHITFHRHEMIGAKIATSLLKRLKFSNEVIERVTHLIRMHMYHYTRDYTDAGIRRFINSAGITDKDIENIGEFDLFKLRKAERLGNGFKKAGVTQRQLDFEERICKLFKESSGLQIADLSINGNDLMTYFGLTPSPTIGKVLHHLIELVLDIPKLNNRRDLLHLALDYLISTKEDTDERLTTKTGTSREDEC